MPDEDDIFRDSTIQGAVDSYQLFPENFARPEWLTAALAHETSRRTLIRRWFAQRLSIRPRWKPCVQIECPPYEEVEINWTGPTRHYEPGSFAREAAAFYAEGED